MILHPAARGLEYLLVCARIKRAVLTMTAKLAHTHITSERVNVFYYYIIFTTTTAAVVQVYVITTRNDRTKDGKWWFIPATDGQNVDLSHRRPCAQHPITRIAAIIIVTGDDNNNSSIAYTYTLCVHNRPSPCLRRAPERPRGRARNKNAR